MAIYTQKCEQIWLKINNRGVGIKMSWVEKNRKINNCGGGGRGGGGRFIRDSRVSAYEYINCLIQSILSFSEVVFLYNIIKKWLSDDYSKAI